MREEIRLPFLLQGKDATLVGWGSTFGVLKEVREELRKESLDVGVVHFNELWPLPPGLKELFATLPRPVVVENNYQGQLARLLERETKMEFSKRINRYDGRPFLVEELCVLLKEVL